MTGQARCEHCGDVLPYGMSFCARCGAPTPTQISGGPLSEASQPHQTEPRHLRDLLQRSLGEAFEIDGQLGEGGFGIVFKARDRKLKRLIAVKVLRRELLFSEGFAERFQREAQALAALRHPGIVPVYSIGESDDLIWIVMPFIEGLTLSAFLKTTPVAPEATALRILREVGEALEAAHMAGLVHRDIKPDNVMLEGPSQRALLMDFGIAKAVRGSSAAMTSTGMVLGTPLYMSPEQVSGDPSIDHRSDIYSLGVLGFQLLTGRLPFAGETSPEVMRHHLVTPAPDPRSIRPDLSESLAEALSRALTKVPSERFQSVREFLDALENAGKSNAGRRVSASTLARATGLALLAGLGVVAAVTAMRPLATVRIKGEIRANDLRFALAGAQPLWPAALPLRTLGVTGLDHFLLPASASRAAAMESESSFYLEAVRTDSGVGSITLDPIALPSGLAIEVTPGGAVGGIHFTFGDSLSPMATAVNGPVNVTIPGQPAETLLFSLERLQFSPASGGLDIDFTQAPDRAGPLLGPLSIKGLVLERIEKIREGNQASDARVSTVVGARISFPELGRPDRELASGETLDLEEFTGTIRGLSVDTAVMAFALDGQVTGLPLSLGGTPTRVEHWWATSPLVVAAFVGTYILMVVLLLRSLRNPR